MTTAAGFGIAKLKDMWDMRGFEAIQTEILV